MHNVFHSFLLYLVSAVLTDGHSTGQASTNFKIRNVKKKGVCFAFFFFKKGLLCLLTAKCSTSLLTTNVLQTFNWLLCA